MKKILFSLVLLVGVAQGEMKDLATPLFWPRNISNSVPATTSVLIDAVGEKHAWIMQLKSTETIRSIGFATGIVTTGDVLEVRLEDLLTSGAVPGVPSGNLLCTNSSATVTTTNTDDSVWKTSTNFGSDCVVNSTVPFAVVLQSTGSLFNGSAVSRFFTATEFQYYASSVNATPYAKQSGPNNVALIRADGTYVQVLGQTIFSGITANTYASGTNPNTRGALFRLPFRARVTGGWACLNFTNVTTSVANFMLMSSTPTTILGTFVATGTYVQAAAAANHYIFPFPNDIVLEANTNYRLVVKSMAASNITFTTVNTPNASADSAYEVGGNWVLTTANNPTQESNWTQTALTHPYMGLIITGIDTNQNNGGISVGY